MKKYNLTIHILFWIVVSSMVSAAIMLAVINNDTINALFGDYFPGKQEVVLEEKEPVIITKIQEVEKETEWYYFTATGYSANDPVQGTNSTTATGKDIRIGMIAVDPKIIPLGTSVEIKDMGTFVAEDTGGKIKGNRIDIYFESKADAKKFGRQGIWVKYEEDDVLLAELITDMWKIE